MREVLRQTLQIMIRLTEAAAVAAVCTHASCIYIFVSVAFQFGTCRMQNNYLSNIDTYHI